MVLSNRGGGRWWIALLSAWSASLRVWGSELMYMEYKAGERTEPWRTPVVGWKGCDSNPASRTVMDTVLKSCCSSCRSGGVQ